MASIVNDNDFERAFARLARQRFQTFGERDPVIVDTDNNTEERIARSDVAISFRPDLSCRPVLAVDLLGLHKVAEIHNAVPILK
jgi:hypothetical protein